MEIIVLYQGLTRKAAACGSERIERPQGCTVGEACEHVSDLHGDALRRLLFAGDGMLGGDILVSVNDRVIQDREATILREGDELAFFTALSGG